MSTRSNIAILTEDGKVKSVYCHSDGYPSHNGKMLLEFHNSKEAAEKIISLGDISFLDEHLEPLPSAPPRHNHRMPEGAILTKHSFDHPQAGVTTFYMRDRKETNCEASTDNSLAEFKPDNDYAYIFMKGKWFICRPYDGIDWVELTPEIVSTDTL